MKQRIIFGLLFCACSFVLHAQNKKTSLAEPQGIPTFSSTASGLQYQIIKEGTGKELPASGGYITFWFQIRTDKDSIIDNQFGNPEPVIIETPKPIYKPSIEEGLLLLTEGDSALFLLNADSLFSNTFHQERPVYLSPQSTIKMIVKMNTVCSKHFIDSVRLEQQKVAAKQRAVISDVDIRDSIAIQKYLLLNNLKGEVTPSGTYVVILSGDPLVKRNFKREIILKLRILVHY